MTRSAENSPRSLYEALAGLRDRLEDLEQAISPLCRPRPRNDTGKKIHPLSGPLRA